MSILTRYNDLIDEIVTQLKTLTPDLADDIASLGGPRVTTWMTSKSPRPGRTEVVVKAGAMTILGGITTKSSLNEFQIFLDLLHYSSDYENGFNDAMGVAQRIYDKFHLTDIGGLSTNKTTVEINPGDGQLNRTLLTIPIRVIIKSEQVITQT